MTTAKNQTRRFARLQEENLLEIQFLKERH